MLSNNARLNVKTNCLHQTIQRWSGETQTPGTAVADGIDISATDDCVKPARTCNILSTSNPKLEEISMNKSFQYSYHDEIS